MPLALGQILDGVGLVVLDGVVLDGIELDDVELIVLDAVELVVLDGVGPLVKELSIEMVISTYLLPL